MSHIVKDKLPGLALPNWATSLRRSALQEMLTLASSPDVISFALGLPAPELFPIPEYTRAVEHVLATDGKALQYGPPFQPLKMQIVELMRLRGVTCRQEQVFLTSGAQQGMNLLTRLLLAPGRQVLLEEMIYTGFQQVLIPFEPEILTVATDLRTGMDVDAVEALLKSGARPALIYAITEGHNPLATSMHPAKRVRLVELARRYGVPIIEDDAYGFLSYEGRSEPPLRALDDQWVFYVGSFSKILAPALRVGWIIVPEELIAPLSVLKEASDIDTSTLAQRTISAFIESGRLSGHIELLRREYGARRDIMLRALHEYFPRGAKWAIPGSGVFIWVELERSGDEYHLMKTAVEAKRVAFIPGHAFSVGEYRARNQQMRLNFSHCAPNLIEEGISRLADVLRPE